MFERFGSGAGSTSGGLTAGLLPAGGLWRRTETQLATRLGVFPGDRVLVLAPPSHDPAPALAARLPRVRFIQGGGRGEFRWQGAAKGMERVKSVPGSLPFAGEAIDAVVAAFAVPLLSPKEHARFVDSASGALYPFGKWFEIVALRDAQDKRLAATEAQLKDAGFEKVRSARLALGRQGGTLFLVTARWPGQDEDASEVE